MRKNCGNCEHMFESDYATQVGTPAFMGRGHAIFICNYHHTEVLKEELNNMCNHHEFKEGTNDNNRIF